jgi:hypothetical protein
MATLFKPSRFSDEVRFRVDMQSLGAQIERNIEEMSL